MYCDYVRIEHDVTKSLNLMAILGTVTRPLHFDFCIFNFDKKIGSRIPCLLYNIKITILVPFGPHKLLKFLRYRFKEKSSHLRLLSELPYPREYKTSYIKIGNKEIRLIFKVVYFLCSYKTIYTESNKSFAGY